ncbi:MAG: Fe-S cluster assembly protein SufD [Bacteroidales bacterium]|nr:Fe-S cluster assembly protein SufD [Bacteroidales bacterium]
MIEQQYIDLFQKCREDIDNNSVDLMNELRDAAFDTFKEMGFPTSKEEEYIHSNISSAFDSDLGLNIRDIPIPVNPYDTFKCDVPNLSTNLHFLVNDRYYENSNQVEGLPEGVYAGGMKEFAKKYPAIFKEYYGEGGDYSKNGLVAYNTMFAPDGFVLYIPKGVKIDKPLQLINILRGAVDLNVNRRLLIIAEAGAKAKLLICDHAIDDVHFVVTQVTEIFANESSEIDFYELEENSTKVTRLSSLYTAQQSKSNVIASNITLHNGYTRNNYRFRLLGEEAHATIGGLAIADKDQHVDNYAFLDHASPNCTSNELFKYVLQERSTGVFCGKILVEKDAQKTLAYQTNRNLLASPDAKMFAKPQLEIYADDVKCSHGLTTGHLNDEALFYLQARGISKEEAKMMLMVAFTKDVVDLINIDSLKERLEYLIDKRFRGELMRCGNCEVCK